jgi:Erv1 / Alr family
MTSLPFWHSKVFGPGVWLTIHVMAAKANTQSKKECFCEFIRDITSSLPCEECRNHAVDYVKKFPPERYIEEKEGIFRWSWIFHNAVNRMPTVNKPELDYETAYKLYTSQDQVCRTDCGSGQQKNDGAIYGNVIAPPPLAPSAIGVSAVKNRPGREVVYIPTFTSGTVSTNPKVRITPRNTYRIL